MALDLQRLASETRSNLDACWADLGVSAAEQASLLEALTADVAAIYRSRVEAQEARRREKGEQVQSMIALIQGMQRAMEESDAEVRCAASRRRETNAGRARNSPNQRALQIPRNGASLIDFYATLESKRAALQEVRLLARLSARSSTRSKPPCLPPFCRHGTLATPRSSDCTPSLRSSSWTSGRRCQ